MIKGKQLPHRDAQAQVPLAALSAKQSRLVERHLPLVELTLQRHSGLTTRRTGREWRELFQEGCLTLAEAIRNYDASRHGQFAPYAMARIHYAISRFAHEHRSAVRVPFITQRRRAEARRCIDRHRPDEPPRVVSLSTEAVRSVPCSRPLPIHDGDESAGPTLGELIRHRVDQAIGNVLDDMAGDPQCNEATRRLIDHCAAERWTIPEPESRLSLRQVAAQHGCTLARVVRSEQRFRTKLAAALQIDAAYQRLTMAARAAPDGVMTRVAREDGVTVRRAKE